MQCVSIDILHFLVAVMIPHSSLERHKTIVSFGSDLIIFHNENVTYSEIQEKPCQWIHICFYTYCWEMLYPWVNRTFLDIFWRRKWQPTPVFLPGESQGRGTLVGCRLWGRTESDTTEVT